VEAGASCVLTSCDYIWSKSTIIRASIEAGTTSGLAATYVPNDGAGGLRVFYHDTGSRVVELGCDFGGGGCWVKSNKSPNVDTGSSLAAVASGHGGTLSDRSITVVEQGSDVNGVWTTSKCI